MSSPGILLSMYLHSARFNVESGTASTSVAVRSTESRDGSSILPDRFAVTPTKRPRLKRSTWSVFDQGKQAWRRLGLMKESQKSGEDGNTDCWQKEG